MRARLATAVAVIVLAIISISNQHHTGITTADVCPNGSNWDNFIHTCH